MRYREIIESSDHSESEQTLELPDIETGDTVLVGKFKNRKATVTGFKTDDNHQPVLQTTKGDQKLFKPRLVKLIPEGEKASLSEAAASPVKAIIQQAMAFAEQHQVVLDLEQASSGKSWSGLLPKTPRAKTIVLSNIETTEPGKGQGSLVMRELVRLADENSIFLVTMPLPGKHGLMTMSQLQIWYMKFDFDYPDGPWQGFLVRKPQS